jgi:hypothetical protein
VPAHFTLIIFGEEHKLRSSSLCNFLQPPATSTLSKYYPQLLFSNITNLRLRHSLFTKLLLLLPPPLIIIIIIIIIICGVPYHHGMERSQVADGKDGLQMWYEYLMADSRKSVVLKLEAGMKTFTVKSSTFRIL